MAESDKVTIGVELDAESVERIAEQVRDAVAEGVCRGLKPRFGHTKVIDGGYTLVDSTPPTPVSEVPFDPPAPPPIRR